MSAKIPAPPWSCQYRLNGGSLRGGLNGAIKMKRSASRRSSSRQLGLVSYVWKVVGTEIRLPMGEFPAHMPTFTVMRDGTLILAAQLMATPDLTRSPMNGGSCWSTLPADLRPSGRRWPLLFQFLATAPNPAQKGTGAPITRPPCCRTTMRTRSWNLPRIGRMANV